MRKWAKKIIASLRPVTSYTSVDSPVVSYDTGRNQLSGDSCYKLKLPANVSAANFWIISIYNNGKNSSDYQNAHPLSSIGSLNKLNYNEDGSVDIYFGPELPKGVLKSNYLKTVSNKAWFYLLRHYSTVPTLDSQTWRAGDCEKIK
ncbi:MAG: DUF1214 domain-containing protein [Methyloprofundus sp.]|nr:DUF1214 domain-containing protein [Methyloprofundus sp.]